MTRAADLAKLIAGGGTITVDDNSDTLTLESTDADANVGPVLNLHRNSASPADNDLAGRIVFKADDDAGNAATFARIEATAIDVSNGGEDGRLDFFTAKDDAFTAALSILGTNIGIGTTSPASGETLTVTASGAEATVRVNGASSQDASLKLQGNNTVTNTFKVTSESDDTGLTIQKWNGSAYVTHIASDANGHVTKPLQPAFLAGPLTGASAQSNLSTGSDVTIIVGNEIYDVNGDFTSNTFTAPVTGKYHLSANITYNHFDMDASNVQSGIKTSNRNYINQIDPDAFHEDADIITQTLTVVADMDANDTASVFYNQTGGSAQTDVGKETTTFSGCLLA